MEENANSRKIIFGNIRGIKPLRNTTKINFIEDYSNMCNGDIICLTETHLKSEIGDSEINIMVTQLTDVIESGQRGGHNNLYKK